MARKCREFHIQDEEIIQLLTADNSDGEDELQLDEEDKQFIEQDIDKGTTVVVMEDFVPDLSYQDIQDASPSTSVTSETIPTFSWRKNSYIPHHFYESEYDFGHVNILSDPLGMLSPMDIFLEVTQLDQLVSDIVKESIKYAQQHGRSFTVSLDEMNAFLGMNFTMSYHGLPTIRNYWSTDEDMGVPYIANVMPRTRFEQIRQNLHFCDNDAQRQTRDRAYKIRPVMNHFNVCFQAAMNNSIRQSIGEHMIKFKGHNSMKQYVKNKPINWGFKMWCRADSSTGYVYQFDFYTDKKTNTEIELGESVVLNLTEQLKGLGCEVYFDDFFNSPVLQHKLMTRNTKACGTVRMNTKNMPKSLPLDENMQRGDIYTVSSNGVTFTKWMDTKAVHMLTNFISPVQTSTVKRRQAGTTQKINVTCPEVVMLYNKYMGGVDLMGQRKACYNVVRKAKMKYYLRLFFGILDIAMNNAYLLYAKLHAAHRVKGPLLSSLEYRQHIARDLINNFTSRQRSRPTLVSSEKLSIRNKCILPAHNMQKAKKKKRCVNCAKRRIESRTLNICAMCNVHLCFTSKRNCFAEYHN